jgi:hypothetical protein
VLYYTRIKRRPFSLQGCFFVHRPTELCTSAASLAQMEEAAADKRAAGRPITAFGSSTLVKH